MTVMPTEPTGSFDLDFSVPYQPDPGPPDVWTASIGGKDMECHIRRDNLVIRMGKSDPDPIGQAEAGTATFEVLGDPDPTDAYEPGEKVVVKRNGLTVWTGWVTDEDREWSQYSGSTSRVNAAGPRSQYNLRYYIPRWGTSGGSYGYDLAYMPMDPGAGGYSERPLQTFVNDCAPYCVHGLDGYVCAEPQGLQVGIAQFWRGAELQRVMDLLDGAADAALGQVWEKRDGRMAVFGHAYYRYEAPASWYTNDTVYLNCDDIGAPVRIRRTPVYTNSYVANRGTKIFGAPIPNEQREQSPAIYYTAPPSGYADREYPSTFLYPGFSRVADKWNFMQAVWNRIKSLEQVDQWIVRREFVDDATWTKLLTMWLGWPVIVQNLPQGLFRDNRTQFSGFLWGWELRGTDEIAMTLIDKALFK